MRRWTDGNKDSSIRSDGRFVKLCLAHANREHVVVVIFRLLDGGSQIDLDRLRLDFDVRFVETESMSSVVLLAILVWIVVSC